MSANPAPCLHVPETEPAVPTARPSIIPDSVKAAVAQAEAILPALLLRARQAAQVSGVSLATWHRLVAAGRTPAPVRLSAGCVRWRAEDLRQWIALGCPDRRAWEAMQVQAGARKGGR
jgi:prophage regulatory protein